MSDSTKRNSNTATVGVAAPDATVYSETGEQVKLSTLWASGPTLLVFVRHFG